VHCHSLSDTLPVHCHSLSDTLPVHCHSLSDTLPVLCCQYSILVETVKRDDSVVCCLTLQFKRYVNKLRTKSNTYKKKKMELSGLRAELGVLARTEEVLSQRHSVLDRKMVTACFCYLCRVSRFPSVLLHVWLTGGTFCAQKPTPFISNSSLLEQVKKKLRCNCLCY